MKTTTRRATTVNVKAGTVSLAKLRLTPVTGELSTVDYSTVSDLDGNALGTLEYYGDADEKWTAVDTTGAQHPNRPSRNAALRDLLAPVPEPEPQPEQQPEPVDHSAQFFAQHIAEAPEDFFAQFEEAAKDAPDEPITPEEQVSIDAVLRTFYVQQAIVQHLTEKMKDERPEVLKALLREWKRSKSKSWEVTVEDLDGAEHKVGTTTLAKTDPTNVVEDSEAFLEWLRANDHADLIEREEIPAREAQVIEKPRDKAIAALIKEKRLKVVRGQLMDTATGEFVPGIRQDPAAEPKSFTAGWGGTGSPGRALILELLEEGDLLGGAIEDILHRKAIEAPKTNQ